MTETVIPAKTKMFITGPLLSKSATPAMDRQITWRILERKGSMDVASRDGIRRFCYRIFSKCSLLCWGESTKESSLGYMLKNSSE